MPGVQREPPVSSNMTTVELPLNCEGIVCLRPADDEVVHILDQIHPLACGVRPFPAHEVLLAAALEDVGLADV